MTYIKKLLGGADKRIEGDLEEAVVEELTEFKPQPPATPAEPLKIMGVNVESFTTKTKEALEQYQQRHATITAEIKRLTVEAERTEIAIAACEAALNVMREANGSSPEVKVTISAPLSYQIPPQKQTLPTK